MGYSFIIQKHCKCSVDCNLFPSIGYKGFNQSHAPQEIIDEKINNLKKRTAAKNTQSKLRNLSYTEPMVRPSREYKSKSELLREADRLFSLFIRNRDADKNGNVACVCCGKIYNVEDKDYAGNRIIQNLHFIQRDVYSLRFDEDNCAAGCCYCNKDMNDNSKGTAYRQYLSVMLENFGEDIVKEMEVAHRSINKITEQQLKNIIEHYQTQTT